MKTLKITLLVALFFASITSCTKQDLNEDDIQIAPKTENTLFTGGNGQDEGQFRYILKICLKPFRFNLKGFINLINYRYI